MGQKTNPVILRLGTTKTYNYYHIEKKPFEHAFYNFKVLEIYNFVYKFFRDNKLIVQNCKINYSDNKTLHIYVSYFASAKTHLANEKLNFQNKQNQYNLIDYLKLINKPSFFYLKKSKQIKFKLKNYYAQKLKIYNKNFANQKLKKKNFLSNLLESLYNFVNKNIKIYLTIKQLNKNLKQKIDKNDLTKIKKSLIKINRYKQTDFFKESINILFLCCQQPTSAKLIADFLANQLQKTKRHYFFIKFVLKCIKIFKKINHSKLKGIRIKITGRINRVPKARHKIIEIGNNLPIFSISSNINYSESVAYTANGTIGIKVWTFF